MLALNKFSSLEGGRSLLLVDYPQGRLTIRLSKQAVLEPAGRLKLAVIEDLLNNVLVEISLLLGVISGGCALAVEYLWLLPSEMILFFLVWV